jgi:predicted DNA-binding protein
MRDNEFQALLPSKPPKKRPFTMYMPPDLMAQLQALSDETGAPVAEIVRRAISSMLAARA